jgi:hypothetical protein
MITVANHPRLEARQCVHVGMEGQPQLRDLLLDDDVTDGNTLE